MLLPFPLSRGKDLETTEALAEQEEGWGGAVKLCARIQLKNLELGITLSSTFVITSREICKTHMIR